LGRGGRSLSVARVGVINMCALRDWLMDIAHKFVLTVAACTACICR